MPWRHFSQQQMHLGFSITHIILRMTRVAMVATAFEQAANSSYMVQSVNNTHCIFWTMWGVMAFACAVAAHNHAYYHTKSTYVMLYFMILFSFAFDFGAAAFAVAQFIAGVDKSASCMSGDCGVGLAQAIGAFALAQGVLMLVWLIVFLAKYEMPNDDDESEGGGGGGGDGGYKSNDYSDYNEAVPLS